MATSGKVRRKIADKTAKVSGETKKGLGHKDFSFFSLCEIESYQSTMNTRVI